MSVDIKYTSDARMLIGAGIEKLAKAVKSTLGPKGKNVVIEQRFGPPIITKDGVTVAQAISLENQYENLGVQMLKEVASKTNDISGDGTTTATVLAEAIYKEGIKNIVAGINPMELKTGIDIATEIVVAKLQDFKREVSDKNEITQVATIAANGDIEIGAQISDAMDKVGKEGIVTIEESKTANTTVEVVDGMQFQNGLLSPYFITDQVKQTAILEDCYILIYEKRISDLQKLVKLLENVQKAGKPILIIAEDLDAPVLTTLVVNQIRGSLKNCAVKAPLFGNYRKDMLQDIALLTGGQAITEDLGIALESVQITQLGRAKKVIITKDSTTIVEGAGKEEKVKERLELIKNQLASEVSDYNRERLQERLAKLSGGVAVISIGATTETELKEKKYRIEDALQATRAAIEEGIVPGGGTALVRCLPTLEEEILNSKETQDVRVGMRIIYNAIQEPLRQIATNSGKEGSVILEKVIEMGKENFAIGYNARISKYQDLFESGVIDPAKVTRVALQNAASVSGLLLTTDTAIVEIKQKETQAPGMQMPGMMG